jgi:hypothetical protein
MRRSQPDGVRRELQARLAGRYPIDTHSVCYASQGAQDGEIRIADRGRADVQGQTGDWMVIPLDTPHQPKPESGGFSYIIMTLNVCVYPWSLVR